MTSPLALRKRAELHYRELKRNLDGDGFVPEVALAIYDRVREVDACIALNGGYAEFPALFDLEGNLVAAKLIERPFGFVWGILTTDDPDSEVVDWFNPSKAISPELERKKNAKGGYYVGTVLARAKAKISSFSSVIITRTDKGFSRSVIITDNGQSRYPD